eukprot:CAMPEP_0180005352 /NCGR_PEP_ID=MMETSP0984-20121128/12648_1 /TAXON_ID=483367 /ORGANISM="non described non described, Strain CCMP 2436" /LENGTH=180 /DNA_ID=CAMNT_0021926055 /DNA_START=333 /DNA_END=875 /DNA_ORIENTATION=-
MVGPRAVPRAAIVQTCAAPLDDDRHDCDLIGSETFAPSSIVEHRSTVRVKELLGQAEMLVSPAVRSGRILERADLLSHRVECDPHRDYSRLKIVLKISGISVKHQRPRARRLVPHLVLHEPRTAPASQRGDELADVRARRQRCESPVGFENIDYLERLPASARRSVRPLIRWPSQVVLTA